MTDFKPSGYTSISPYLIVSDATKTIKFLEMTFSATVLRTIPDPNGRMMHSEVRVDDSVIMIADSAPDWTPLPSHVHVYVSDVDAIYALAIEFGAESVQPPERKEDEDKRGGVKDAGGTTWWIATRLG